MAGGPTGVWVREEISIADEPRGHRGAKAAGPAARTLCESTYGQSRAAQPGGRLGPRAGAGREGVVGTGCGVGMRTPGGGGGCTTRERS